MKWLIGLVLVFAAATAGCGNIEDKGDVVLRPKALSQPVTVGVGDIVLYLKQSQSLKNVFGRADMFGRTETTGRVRVRYVGINGDRATFIRDDTAIEPGEQTIVPTSQTTMITGTVGTAPVYGTATSSGYGVVSTPAQATQLSGIQLSAAPGETLLVEGHTIRVISADRTTITYSVQ